MTVKYLSLEGGFYGLITSDGMNLLPLNLAKSYQVVGTVLKVEGYIINDMATIQQWGKPFKITTVKLLKKGQNNKTDTH